MIKQKVQCLQKKPDMEHKTRPKPKIARTVHYECAYVTVMAVGGEGGGLVTMRSAPLCLTRDTCLPNIHTFRELVGARPIRRENGRSVAVWVCIDQADRVVKAVHLQTAQNWPENLLFVACHFRLHISSYKALEQLFNRCTKSFLALQSSDCVT